MKKSQRQKLNFYLVASGFILFTGLLIALFLPEITAWRWSVIDRLIEESSTAKTESQQYLYLSQASLIGRNDSAATAGVVNFWREKGELSKAIESIEDNIAEPNDIYLGNLALQAQDYSAALKYFEQSSAEAATTQSLAGESVSYFNLGKTEQGCSKANEASKLDLQNKTTEQLILVCELTTKDAAVSPREAASTLWQAKIYALAEEKLLAIENKSAQEWLLLSRLASSRGELSKATQYGLEAHRVAPAKRDVLENLTALYRLEGNDQEVSKYQSQLRQLEFRKYSQ